MVDALAPTTPVPIPAPVAPPVADTASAVTAPATDNATIVFTNVPDANCGACETLKVSVTPSGQVLIEDGHWAGNGRNWVYKRSVAHVAPDRVAAFAASLSSNRPAGEQLLSGGPTCPGPATEDDGLTIEWIEADRHDLLTFNFRCPARRDSPFAERLRHAPDALGLHQLVFPWGSGR